MCLVHTTQALSLQVQSEIEDRTRKCLSPLSICVVSLPLLYPYHWSDRIPIQCLMKSHNQFKARFNVTSCILEICFHCDIFELSSYTSRLSISIDFIDLLCYKSHHICRVVFTALHAVCFKQDVDAWSCECRIKNGVFQGHVFWSGISLLRSYSQQYSKRPWKGV